MCSNPWFPGVDVDHPLCTCYGKSNDNMLKRFLAMLGYDWLWPLAFFTQAACQSVQASIRDRKSPLSKNARITPYFRWALQTVSRSLHFKWQSLIWAGWGTFSKSGISDTPTTWAIGSLAFCTKPWGSLLSRGALFQWRVCKLQVSPLNGNYSSSHSTHCCL